MEKLRKPFQGVTNIIRFNWHFYAISILAIILIFTFIKFLTVVAILLGISVLISLLVSYYIYDLSNLHTLNWLDQLNINKGDLVNIHAGFDETSELIQHKYATSNLTIFDFYNEQLHTEISIKRARKLYKSPLKNIIINTNKLPLKDLSIDTIFVLFAAHEIRKQKEREVFFKELNRVLKSNGSIIITEHLRNFPNFIAYNIGFFHFLTKKIWLNTFKNSELKIEKQIKITPFITTYKLTKHGTTP